MQWKEPLEWVPAFSTGCWARPHDHERCFGTKPGITGVKYFRLKKKKGLGLNIWDSQYVDLRAFGDSDWYEVLVCWYGDVGVTKWSFWPN